MRKREKPQQHGPMTAMLQATEGSTRFHMPGHKGILDPFDITELARTDDLYAPTAGIAEAERLAAASCHAAKTLMLAGGSTAGLITMILSNVSPGETLILPRNVHHAVLSACIWGDINAIFADDLPTAIRENPQAAAVLLTRPDYYGVCADLSPIVEAAHASGAKVLVDEAHGAHFSWWDVPKSAAYYGADAWVQSAHKTLPALTGAAWLHLGEGQDAGRARRFLRMVQTSSPSFPILQSLDEARVWMDAYGRDTLAALCAQLKAFREKLAAIGGYENIPSDDPTRLVVGTRGHGYTGIEVQEQLSAHFVDVEMADDRCIVCICTVADKPEAYARLLAALRSIPQRDALPPIRYDIPLPGPRALTLRQAALSAQEAVPLAQAEGRTAAISAGMYPPGIPYVLPGEQVTAICIENLSNLPAHRRFGVENDCLICVK